MDTYKDDIEWANKFHPMKYNDIVTLENTTVGVGEVFEVIHNDHEMFIEILAYTVPVRAGRSDKRNLKPKSAVWFVYRVA